jgi:hypothetical protein
MLGAAAPQNWSILGVVVVGLVLMLIARFVLRSPFFGIRRERAEGLGGSGFADGPRGPVGAGPGDTTRRLASRERGARSTAPFTPRPGTCGAHGAGIPGFAAGQGPHSGGSGASG